jgi:hypothetical protein
MAVQRLRPQDRNRNGGNAVTDTLHIFIIGTLTTMIAGSYGFGWLLHRAIMDRYEDGVAAAKKIADEALGNCHSRIGREIQRLEQNFYEYKLHVASGFASMSHLQDVERRTEATLRAINEKLDRLIENRGNRHESH